MKAKPNLPASTRTIHAVAGVVLFFLYAPISHATLLNTITATNTFEDSVFTGGTQSVFDQDTTAIIDPGVEFSLFAGVYDIDVNGNTLTMTLADNSTVADLVLPSGRFDRYYFEFNTAIASVMTDLLAAPGYTATASVITPGSDFNFTDVFGTGLPTVLNATNGGLLVEIQPGSDLNNLGQALQFDIIPVPVPSTVALSILGLFSLAFQYSRRVRSGKSLDNFDHWTVTSSKAVLASLAKVFEEEKAKLKVPSRS